MDEFLEHPLRCSRKSIDLAPRPRVLVDLDSVELRCLDEKNQI
jgi:hypothetical protein